MDLDDALRKLNWRRVDLARRLGVKPETVSRWGPVPPKYVCAYLRSQLLLLEMRDKADREIRP